MCDALAAEAPFWKPGTRNGYHGVTSAWTVGEMVHRSTGTRMGRFLAEEIAGPLDAEFWMGLPEALEPRVAPMIFYPPDERARTTRIALAMAADPTGPTARFMAGSMGLNPNSREAHAAEIGSATGISNGRGLAMLYAPLANGGALNGRRFVGADTLTRMGRVSVATHEDATLAIPTRFSLGFMKAMDNRKLSNAENCSVIMSEAAFGHVGAGGSLGFADPDARMSFGYAMNKMGPGDPVDGGASYDTTHRRQDFRRQTGRRQRR
jgi:CubicO group peptidase (beta-lactamase class C family)